MVQRLNLRAFLFLSLIFSLSLSPASWSKTKKLSVAQVAAQQATQESNSQSLTLEMFLDQVREGNKDFEAATKASQGAKLRANEASFVTGPFLFGEASYGEDKMEPNSPTQPNDLRATKFSLGIQEQFSFGLGAKLSYINEKYDLRGAQPTVLPPGYTSFYRSRPQAELNFPLLKNFLGAETRAQKNALLNKGKAKEYAESFRSKMLLAEAESVYWKLALARTLVKSAKDNLDRAEKMSGWSTRRKNLGLADEAQFLQADANHELRQLEYQNAVDDERATRRRFNSLRGIADNNVSEELLEPSSQMISQLKVPETFSEREDLKAQRAELRAKKAATVIDSQKFKPNLDLFGLYAWNGKDADRKEAESESFRDARSTYGVGVRFTMPLDGFTLAKQQRGYKLEEKAAELQLERKEFESVRDWEDLTSRFLEGRERFKILLKIEIAQRKKLQRERDLQGRGRSTLFNVLLYESEYAQTQVARTRAQVDLLSLYAVLKTFPNPTDKSEKN